MTTLGRLTYDRRFNYNDKVLLGNWYEERKHFENNKHKHDSTYNVDFVPKKYSKLSNNEVWFRIISNHGSGPRIVTDHHGNAYHGNFSSTYDISYNHLPRWSKTQNYKKRYSKISNALEPQQDFCRNYGNITKYGLLDQKKMEWDASKNEILKSLYQESYLWPTLNDYPKRHSPPKETSSRAAELLNFSILLMNARNKALPIAYDFPVKIPKKKDCPLILKCRP